MTDIVHTALIARPDPFHVSGLRFLYAADDETKWGNNVAVDQFLDRSENENHTGVQGVEANRPLFRTDSGVNGRAGFSFDTDDFLDLPANVAAALSGQSGATFLLVLNRATIGAAQSVLDIRNSAGDSKVALSIAADNTLVCTARAAAADVASSVASVATVPAGASIITATINLAADSVTLSVNGDSNTVGTVGFSAGSFDADAGVSRIGAATNSINNTLLETLGYNRALTAAELAFVQYYLSVRYAVPTLPNHIGYMGSIGACVGSYPGTLPTGFEALTGSSTPGSDNYGNYKHTASDSIMCWIPKCYYRIGSTSSPRYAAYGVNAWDIASVYDFPTTAQAEAAGYRLFRAFIDGGEEKDGFFIDKYLCSKNAGNTMGISVQHGIPISLTTTSTYTRSQGMVTPDGTCTGILADAIMLCRARGAGFHNESIFQFTCLAALSLAHGHAATSTAACAWFHATTNYPKGCDNNALGSVNDSAILWDTAGDAGSANKPKTGSCRLTASDAGSGDALARSTHNGQLCGVADLAGSMWEVAIGLTTPGSSATSTTQIADGNAYVLKTSVALKNLLNGWTNHGVSGDANNAWGNAGHIATLYDYEEGLLPWGADVDWINYGNVIEGVVQQVFGQAEYARTNAGIQRSNDAMSVAGTNLFGTDGCYRYIRHNLFPLCGGLWVSSGRSGVFARFWFYTRSIAYGTVGFRAAAYF